MKKTLLIATAIIILMLIVIPTVAYFSLKNKDLQKWASESIKSRTGIEISMENYSLSFPARVLVHNLLLKTPDGIKLSADEVNVRPSMLKLISGKLYLKSVSVTGATVTIPLDRKIKVAAPKESDRTRTEKAETTSGELPLGKLEIRNATFRVTSREKTTEISGIHVLLEPGTRFQLAMSPGDPANELKLTGTLENKNALKTLNGSLRISKIKPLLKLLPEEEIPIDKLSGTARFSLDTSDDNFSFRGSFDFPTLTVTLDKGAISYPVKGEINGTASMDGSFVKLGPSKLTIRDSTFKLSGKLMPDTLVSFSGDKLDLQGLTELIPPSQSPFPEGTHFQGGVELSGTGGSNGISAQLIMKDDQIALSGMTPLNLAGKLTMTEKEIHIANLLLNNAQTDLAINGTINQYLSDHGSSNLEIRGKMINFASKTKNMQEKREKQVKSDSRLQKTGENKPIPVTYPDFEGMIHHIDCAIGSVVLPGLTLSELETILIAGDKGTFLKKCIGRTLGGSFAITGKLLPEGKGISFSTEGQTNKLKLTGILSNKFPVEGGRLSTAFNMSGTGSNSDELKQTASGTLTFNVSDATLRDTPALKKVEELTSMKFVGKKMDHFDGEAKIRDGKAEIRNTRMSARGIRADFNGTVSLDGQLNMKVPVQLSGEAGKKLPAKLRLLESGGKVTLPLEIKGELRKPKVKLDLKNAKKAIEKKLKKKLLNKLFGN
jgi:hypothetical protein